MNYNLHKIIAFTNLREVKQSFELAVAQADGERKARLKLNVDRLTECEAVFRYMEKTMDWYAKKHSDYEQLRASNWEKDQTIKRLGEQIEKLKESIEI